MRKPALRARRRQFESLEARHMLAAEMEVRGNTFLILDGDASPSGIDGTLYGNASVAGGLVNRTYTINNLGDVPLNLTGDPLVQFTGAAAGDYSVITPPASSIAPAGSTTFVVQFDPSASGPRLATLNLANDDADENPYNFNLSGTGVAPTVIAVDDTFAATENQPLAVGSVEVVPFRAQWRSFEDMTRTGVNAAYPGDGTAGDDWNDRSFNLASPSFGQWKPLAVAPFASPANGVTGLTAPVTALSTAFTSTGGATRVTSLFRTNFSLTASQAAATTATVRALCDDGCAGYVNGVEVFRLRLPTLSATAEATTSPDETTINSINVNFATAGITLFPDGSNVFAVEVHQSDAASSDIGFDAALTLNVDGGLLANDNLAQQNGALAISLVNQPTDSTTGQPAGTVTLNGNTGSFTYAPQANYSGTATFRYQLNDASNQPTTATVTLNVAAANDAPVAVDDEYTGERGQTLTASVIGQPIIEGNDSLWYYQDTGEDQDALNPAWRGAPASNFNPVAAGWKGPSRSQLGFGEGDEHTTIANAGGAGGLTYYFQRTFDVAGSPSRLILEVKRDDGVAIYINGAKVVVDNLPNPHPYNVAASTDTVDDGQLYRHYVVDTTNLGLLPTGNTIAAEVHQRAAASTDVTFDLRLYNPTFGLLGNDEDVDDDSANLSVVNVTHTINPATQGTLVVQPDGTFTFTPANANVVGTFTFTYRVQDDQSPTPAVSAPATVTLTLTPPAGSMLLPDLISWSSQTAGLVYDWQFDLTVPNRRLMRFSTSAANIGLGPMELRGGTVLPNGTQEVNQIINLAGGGTTSRLAGEFIYHADHGHIHFEGFGQYHLRTVLPGGEVGPIVATGGKTSFCLLDIRTYDLQIPGAPTTGQYGGCASTQGISVGWADVYNRELPDQWIDVTNIPLQEYWLEVTIDPFNALLETDETNNTARILVDLAATFPVDSYEVNDSFATAANINSGDVSLSNLTIHRANNDDYFRWTATANGTLRVSSAFQNSAGNVNLLVYDINQQLLGSSTGTTDSELVTLPVTLGQTLYIVATGAAGATSPAYSLTIDSPEPSADIRGSIFDDRNNNHARDNGEPPLSGWTVYLDGNNNGVFEPQQTVNTPSTNVPIPIIDFQVSESNITIPGGYGPISDVEVTINITHTYDADLNITLVSPNGTRVDLASDVGGSENNFTNTIFDDEAAVAIASGTAPFTGRFRPASPLSAFDGQLPGGVWTLEVEDDAGVDQGSLVGWTLTLATGETSTTTAADGAYAFTELAPGTYRVREVVRPGWTKTAPAPDTYTVTIAVNNSAAGLDFGNRNPAPHVTQVLVDSTTDSRPAYVLPVGGGSQLLPVEAAGVDRITLVFDEQVDVAAGQLTVRGAGGAPLSLAAGAAGFASGAGPAPGTWQGTWTLAAPVHAASLVLELADSVDDIGDVLLDGDWTNPVDLQPTTPGSSFPSGDGTTGGGFAFRVNVLTGDITQDLTVDRADVLAVAFGMRLVSGATWTTGDIDGDGRASLADLALVQSNLGQSLELPPPSPAASPVIATVEASRSLSTSTSRARRIPITPHLADAAHAVPAAGRITARRRVR